jgi:hypothetical protein
MRAQLVERNSKLMIFKNSDDTYSAVRDSFLYTFLWNPIKAKLYNFKNIGKISPNYSFNDSRVLKNPHIQMIMQLQNKISLKESMENVLKPKTEEEAVKDMFKGDGFYALIIDFGSTQEIEFTPINNAEELEDFFFNFKDRYSGHYDTLDLIKLDINKTSSISYASGTNVFGDGIEHIGKLYDENN